MFYNVYIKEAHPTDGWRMSGNDSAGISFRQPKSFDERFGVAEQCSTRLDMNTPVLVDDMDNTTCDNYAAFPDRLYIVDTEGKVAYKGGRGPFGYKPRELEQSLLLVMMDSQIKARETAAKVEKEAEIKAEKMAKEKEQAREKAAEDAQRKLDEKKKEALKNTKEAKNKTETKKSPKQKSRPEPPGPDREPKKRPKNSRGGPIRIG